MLAKPKYLFMFIQTYCPFKIICSLSLCRFIYPGLEIIQFLVHFMLRIKKFNSQELSRTSVSFIISEQMRRVFGKYIIPAYFKPTNTLQQLLVTLKDPMGKENVVGPVYKIKCEECDAVYVCETERSLKARFSEHQRPSSTTSEVSNTSTLITPTFRGTGKH